MAGQGMGSWMGMWSGPTPLPFGFWVPWDALVSNIPAVGDFTSISAACTAMPAGSIIAVDSNSTTPYIEVGNITLKEGQVLLAFDGDGRIAGTVAVQMSNGVANYVISAPNDNAAISGITFDWSNATAALAGTDVMSIAGSNFRGENVVLYWGGGAPLNFHGLFMSGSNNYLRDFQVNGTPRCVNPLNLTGSNNVFDNCIFYGGDGGGAGPGSVIAGGNNRFLNTPLTSDGVNTVSGNSNVFRSSPFAELSALAAALTNSGTDNIFVESNLNTGFGTCLNANGARQSFNRCVITSAGGGTAIAVAAVDGTKFVDCSCDANMTIANGSTNTVLRGLVMTLGTLTISGQAVKLSECQLVNLTLAATAVSVFEVGCTISGVITDTATRLQRGIFLHQGAAAPTVNDDVNDGFLGDGMSRWFDTRAAPLGQIEYRCHSNAVGAAVWIPIGTAGLYSVLIHPVAGIGQYQTISAFCTAEPVGTIAGIAPGTYTEVGNITFLAGQQVFGLGGVDNTALESVLYQMGNFTLTNAANSKIEGIYFTHTVTTADQQSISLTGASGWVVRNCTFDFTPTGAFDHMGIIYSGTNWKIQDVNILCDARTYRAIFNNGGTDGVMENVKVTGGMTTAAANHEYLVRILSSARSKYENITITTPDATVQVGALLGVSAAASKDGDHYSNIHLIHTLATAAAGNGLYYFDTGGADHHMYDLWSNLTIKYFYDGVRTTRNSHVKFENCTIGSDIAKCGDSSVVQVTSSSETMWSNCTMFAVGTTLALADNANHWHLSNCYIQSDGATSLSIATSTWLKITGSRFLGSVTIDGTTGAMISSSNMDAMSLGPAAATTSVELVGCVITTLTNGAFTTGLRIAGCSIPTFTDSGTGTIRDVYTQRTAIATPVTVRTSSEYNNAGAAGAVVYNLPAAVAVENGYKVRFVVAAAQNMVVTAAAGDVISNGVVSTAAGGTATSATLFSVLELMCLDATNWVATSQSGLWNLV